MAGVPDPGALTVGEAAEELGLSASGVEALIEAGFLRARTAADRRLVALSDVKAVAARLVDVGPAPVVDLSTDPPDVDPAALLDALDGRCPELARRTFDTFVATVPEAAQWSEGRRERFLSEAEERFEVLLAVTARLDVLDDELLADLRDIGSGAAADGTPLTHLLLTLRITRDLLAQGAVEVAEQAGRHWGLALSLVLGRIHPAVDRLTDALADGYWRGVVGGDTRKRLDHEHVLDRIIEGVYETDVSGRVRWANAGLARMLGVPAERIVGQHVSRCFQGVEATELLGGSDDGVEELVASVTPPGGGRRLVRIQAFGRRIGSDLVGYQGIVSDLLTSAAAADDHDRPELRTGACRLNPVLDQAVHSADARRVNRRPPMHDVMVRTHPGIAVQVLANLLEEAATATGRAAITATAQEDIVRVRVEADPVAESVIPAGRSAPPPADRPPTRSDPSLSSSRGSLVDVVPPAGSVSSTEAGSDAAAPAAHTGDIDVIGLVGGLAASVGAVLRSRPTETGACFELDLPLVEGGDGAAPAVERSNT